MRGVQQRVPEFVGVERVGVVEMLDVFECSTTVSSSSWAQWEASEVVGTALGEVVGGAQETGLVG